MSMRAVATASKSKSWNAALDPRSAPHLWKTTH
jgi:hypothetical protein